MQLDILGNYGPWPPADGACSSYLVRAAQGAVLLDCGSGSISALQRAGLKPWQLDAIVLSHLHKDHTGDIGPCQYSLAYAQKEGLRDKPVPVYAPGEPADEFKRLGQPAGTGGGPAALSRRPPD